MYILTPYTYNNTFHMNKVIFFNDIQEIQYYLENISSKWDIYSICPIVYIIAGNKAIELSEEDHKKLIYPHTYTSRNRKEQ